MAACVITSHRALFKSILYIITNHTSSLSLQYYTTRLVMPPTRLTLYMAVDSHFSFIPALPAVCFIFLVLSSLVLRQFRDMVRADSLTPLFADLLYRATRIFASLYIGWLGAILVAKRVLAAAPPVIFV